jgi:flagellar hook-associated protein 2
MPVGITGLTSDFDSDKLIQKLIEVEKRPIQRMQDEKELIGLKIEVLQALDNDMIRLRQSVKSLYGINSVFRNKEAYGVDAEAFSADPGPHALRGETKIEIEQVAAAHSVASLPFDPSTAFKAGSFTVILGTNTLNVAFNGGTAADVADAINRQCQPYVSASVIRDTSKTVVLVLTSKVTGQDNELGLSDPDGVFSVIPLLEKKKVSVFALNKDNDFLEANWQNYKGSDQKLVALRGEHASDGNELVLSSAAREVMIDSLSVDSSYRLEITYRIKKRAAPESAASSSGAAPGSTIFARLFSAFVKDIEVKGVPFPVNDGEEPEAAAVPERQSAGPDIGVGVAYASAKREERLASLQASTNAATQTVDLDGAPAKINRIVLWSGSDEWDLAVQSVRVFSKRQKDVDFARTLQAPRDAKFKINDVDVRRPNNNDISDVIRDVSLDLKAPTKKPVTFTVDYDYGDIALQLTTFVSNYNKIINFIDDVQKTSVSDKPGEYNKADRGVFSGDMAFANIKSKLRGLVSAPYPTALSNRLALLFQVGISTGEWGSSFDETRTGRLKYDREKFERSFQDTPEAVQELFSSDSDGDMKPNDGMAFKMDLFLGDVVRPKAGIIDLKIQKIKEDLRQKDKEIADKETQVEGYESKLRQQYQNMDKNMADLKAQERWLKMNTESQKKDE